MSVPLLKLVCITPVLLCVSISTHAIAETAAAGENERATQLSYDPIQLQSARSSKLRDEVTVARKEVKADKPSAPRDAGKNEDEALCLDAIASPDDAGIAACGRLTELRGATERKRAQFFLWRAKSLEKAGKKADALLDFDKSIELDRTADALSARGDYYRSIEDYVQALLDYDEAIDKYTRGATYSDANGFENYKRLRVEGDRAAAAEQLARSNARKDLHVHEELAALRERIAAQEKQRAESLELTPAPIPPPLGVAFDLGKRIALVIGNSATSTRGCFRTLQTMRKQWRRASASSALPKS